MTASTDTLTIGEVVEALRVMAPEQRAEIWPALVEAFKLMRLSPTALWPVDGVSTPTEHGHFRSHLDLPLLTPEQSQQMAPVFNAVYELVKQHQHCACDPTVMAWRAAYAAALVLLTPPQPDGAYGRAITTNPADQVRWGWRCSLPHGDYTAVVERESPGWGRREAVKAYKSHMKTKHPERAEP